MGFRRAPKRVSGYAPSCISLIPDPPQGLPPPCTAARASWLPAPFHQQRLQDRYSSLAELWANKAHLPIPKETMELKGKILGEMLCLWLIHLQLAPPSWKEERNAPSSPLPTHSYDSWWKNIFCHLQTAFCLGRRGARQTPVGGTSTQLIVRTKGDKGNWSSAEEENHDQLQKEFPPLSPSFVWGGL